MKKNNIALFIVILVIIITSIFFIKKNYFFAKNYKINYTPGTINNNVIDFAAPDEQYRTFTELAGTSEKYQTLTKDNTYLDVVVPKYANFNKIDVNVKFRNPDQQQQISLGIIDNNNQYNFKPLQITNQELLNLNKDDWNLIEKDNIMLWQKYEKFKKVDNNQLILQKLPVEFNSIDDFLSKINSVKEKTVFYNYQDQWGDGTEYPASAKGITVDRCLRGQYIMYTNINHEDLSFKFTVQNINANIGENDITIILADKNGEIYRQAYKEDKKIVHLSNQPTVPKEIIFEKKDLPTGVYKIIFSASDNFITKEINAAQDKLVFTGNLFLVNSPYYQEKYGLNIDTSPTSLQLFGHSISFSTKDEKSLQDIKINDQTLKITEIKQNFFAENLQDKNKIFIPKNNVVLTSNGFLSFSDDGFFVPITNYNNWEEGMDLSQDNYILANFVLPTEQDGWLYAKAEFNKNEFQHNQKSIQFVISAPTLASNNKKIDVANIKIDFLK